MSQVISNPFRLPSETYCKASSEPGLCVSQIYLGDIKWLFLIGKSGKKLPQLQESHQTNFIGESVSLPLGSCRIILFACQ